MAQEINLGGTIYISSQRAAEITGYSQDYVGQLARSGAITAKKISGLWYILEASVRQHKEKAETYVPKPPPPSAHTPEQEVSISFDGKDYVSAHRAATITGYSQDYVGQLARSGHILSRQIGNRWYVDREALVQHKKEKDALLAAVQRDAVGLAPRIQSGPENKPGNPISDERDTHFKYNVEFNESILSIPETEDTTPDHPQQDLQNERSTEGDDINQIPIRVLPGKKPSIPTPSFSEIEVPSDSQELRKRIVVGISGGVAILFCVLAFFFFISYRPENEQNIVKLQDGSKVEVTNSSFRARIDSLLGRELVYRRK